MKLLLFVPIVLAFLLCPSVMAQRSEYKFEAGGQYSLLNRSPAGEFFTDQGPTSHELGARAVYWPSRWWSLEAEYNFFPTQENDFSNFSGRKHQVLAGVKGGPSTEHLGFYAKLRPGFMHFAHVSDCPDGTFPSCNFDGKLKPVLDFGGVVEYYATKRATLRFDFGDTVIWYGSVTRFPFAPENPSPIRLRSGTTHNFQFSAGFSFRF